MNKLRTLLASILFLIGIASSWADDYKYLTIAQNNGETTIDVTSIVKITFDDTNMVIHLSDGNTQTMLLSDLQRMFFSNTTGIMSITQSKMHFSGGVLRAEIATGEYMEIFDMRGRKVFSANQSGSFDLTTLTKGIYIVKVGNETRKVVNR
jgi:hypothetical protein